MDCILQVQDQMSSGQGNHRVDLYNDRCKLIQIFFHFEDLDNLSLKQKQEYNEIFSNSSYPILYADFWGLNFLATLW